jgi:Na+/H+ antiporter NhaC
MPGPTAGLRVADPAPQADSRSHEEMNAIKLLGAVVLAAGVMALVYGSFSYTKDTTAVKLGPLELTVKEKETVNVPVWAGVGAIVVGGLMLAFGGKRG